MKELSENAVKILNERYLLKDEDGDVIETIPELFDRVAYNIALSDRNYIDDDEVINETYNSFHKMISDLDFLPNSPTLMNAGNEDGQLSACFVLPIEDSINSIFDTLKKAALIHKSGGGTGFAFSRIREKDSVVKTTGGVASGPISFMKIFNAATEEIKQGGKRRGANMGMLRVDHPDILEFIDCKTIDGQLNNFNISVAITDQFMKAVKNNTEYDLYSPKTNECVKSLNARYVFNKIVHNAWNNGEPGIFFIDKANKFNPIPSMGLYESTNPCGEQILLPNESCNLGSINLANMVIEYDKLTHRKITYRERWIEENYTKYIDYDKLKYTVKTAVHFMDNVIDANVFPFEDIEKITKAGRKIGLGIMGWAEMLLKLGIPYNSDTALSLSNDIMSCIESTAIEASKELAITRGAFPEFDNSIFNISDEYGVVHKLRNATVTTIAPTGSLSAIANTSSGIEPYFSFAYEKHVMDTVLIERNNILEEVLKEFDIYSPELIQKIVNNHGMVKGIKEIPEQIKNVFVSAHEISPKDHVKMQAEFQKFVDNAISKTINFTNEATEQDIYDVFMYAYDMGCKGLTVYRDGSRSTQVLVSKSSEEENITEENIEEECEINNDFEIYPTERPVEMDGRTRTVKIGCGKILVTVNHDDNNKVKEVAIHTSKTGGCHAQSQAIGRLISIALRSNIAIDEIIHQLRGIKCNSCKSAGLDGTSCPDAIGRFIESERNRLNNFNNQTQDESNNINLKKVIENNQNAINKVQYNNSKNKCPECGAELTHESGCLTCYNCGYQKCTG